MNDFSNFLIGRHSFAAQTLMDSHPPKIRNANKKIVFNLASPPGAIHRGELIFSRWQAMPLPPTVTVCGAKTQLEIAEDYFTYPCQNSEAVEWHLNFAHCDAFAFYGGPLFAQDEMQAAEHPALGALREALLAAQIKPLTVESGQPTPILVRGVERRCAIAIAPDAEAGRPYGLYGNLFAEASPGAIARATTPLEPPAQTHLIAIEAPCGGYGSYRLEDIEYILLAAFTGFSAAKIESHLAAGENARTVIHTGFWGCGAYGGDRVLMALLQLLAAQLSCVERLVFHTGNAAGALAVTRAKSILEGDLLPKDTEISLSNLLEKIVAMEFQWGVGDGN